MSQDERPQPLTPIDGNLIHYPSVMIPRAYLKKLIVKFPADNAAMLRLLMESWQQIPAGSLPNDDCELAEFCGLNGAPEVFAQKKATILSDWVECTDGRLYNRPMAETVKTAVAGSIRSRFKLWCSRMRKAPNLPSPGHKFNQPQLEEWLQAGMPDSWPNGYCLKTTDSSGKAPDSTGNEDSSTGIPLEFGLKGKEKERNEKKKNEMNLLSQAISAASGERDVDQDEDFNKVQQQLLSAGWLGRSDQARAIYEQAKTKTDGSLSHLLTPEMIARCNFWPESTPWLLKCLKSLPDKQIAQLPPGKDEEARRSIAKAEEVQAQAQANQEQGRIALHKAFLSLPAPLLAELKEDFLKSPDSVISRVAIERGGWDSTSGAIWGPMRGWLSKHDPNLLAQLTNKPVGSVFPRPLPGVATSPAEEFDQDGLARVAEMLAKG